MHITVVNILVILFVVALLIFLLDATAGRGVITGNGQAHLRAITQCQLRLHQSLTVGAPAHNHAAVVILDRPGENLTGRG